MASMGAQIYQILTRLNNNKYSGLLEVNKLSSINSSFEIATIALLLWPNKKWGGRSYQFQH